MTVCKHHTPGDNIWDCPQKRKSAISPGGDITCTPAVKRVIISGFDKVHHRGGILLGGMKTVVAKVWLPHSKQLGV